ncbi:MAG: class I SAM-dependent methyltransferase [Patescibacteria group bacterium]|nr:class I SAM-dependent methyltransferase [Patescibacteria group bacterium]
MKNYRPATGNFYDQKAKVWCQYVADSFWYEKQFRDFVSYFRPGARVLDIGCAWGIHIPLFLGVGSKLKYEGLDISRGMLKTARAHFPQMTFHRADVFDF